MSHNHDLRCAKSLMVGMAKQYCRICQSGKTGEGYSEPNTVDWRDFVRECEDCLVKRIIRGETEFPRKWKR